MSHFASIRITQEKLRRGEQSCTALAEEYLARIRARASLNAFITILDERTRARANAIDAKIRQGKAGKLAGCIVAVKDILGDRKSVV